MTVVTPAAQPGSHQPGWTRSLIGSPSASVRMTLRLGSACLGVVALMVVFVGIGDVGVVAALTWGLLVLPIVLALAFFPALTRDVFHPLSYALFGVVVWFVLPATVIRATGSASAPFEHYPTAALLVAGSVSVYLLGFSSRLGHTLARVVPLVAFPGFGSPSSDGGRLPGNLVRRALLLYALGWVGRLARVRIGYSHLPSDLGGAWRILGFLSDLHIFALAAFTLLVYLLWRDATNRLRRTAFIVLMTCLEVGAGALEGGREAILLPAVALGVAVSAAGVRVSWKKALAALAVLILFIGPLLTLFRAELYSRIRIEGSTSAGVVTSSAQGALARVIGSRNEPLGVDLPATWGAASRSTVGRLSTVFESTLRVVDRVPSRFEYAHGNTFVPVIVTFVVPRAIWGSKPVYGTGRVFAQQFWDREVDPFGTSIGIGMPGEAYFNFGWYGLALFFPLGVFLRFAVEQLRLYALIEGTFVVRHLFVITTIAKLNEAIAGWTLGVARIGITYLVFLMLLSARPPKLVRGAG